MLPDEGKKAENIDKMTCQQRDSAEHEGYAGGQTYMRITENNITNADKPSYGLLEQILSPIQFEPSLQTG